MRHRGTWHISLHSFTSDTTATQGLREGDGGCVVWESGQHVVPRSNPTTGLFSQCEEHELRGEEEKELVQEEHDGIKGENLSPQLMFSC